MWSGAVNILISGGFSSAYEQLLPEFERTSGIKVTTRAFQGAGPQTIAAQLASGVPADVVPVRGSVGHFDSTRPWTPTHLPTFYPPLAIFSL